MKNTFRFLSKHHFILFSLVLITFLLTGCSGTAYVMHVASGQHRLLTDSIPKKEALTTELLDQEQKDLLNLIDDIKRFGEDELGLKKTQNYESVYIKTEEHRVHVISASPKDHLTNITWWFPIVGKMPYLGFFDINSAKKKIKTLEHQNFDTYISRAGAYSTLGWFKDPVTIDMLNMHHVDLVDTILHEMTHTTLYIKNLGDFNENLALLVGKFGCLYFMQKFYGPDHPFTYEAKRAIDDERLFSEFLKSLLERLDNLYSSEKTYEQKLTQREIIFSDVQKDFKKLLPSLQTKRFIHFNEIKLNNAFLLSLGLYHNHFQLFENLLMEKKGDIKTLLLFLENIRNERGDMLERINNLRVKEESRT